MLNTQTNTALPRKRKEPVYPVSGEEIVFDEELHEEGRFLTPLLRKLAELEPHRCYFKPYVGAPEEEPWGVFYVNTGQSWAGVYSMNASQGLSPYGDGQLVVALGNACHERRWSFGLGGDGEAFEATVYSRIGFGPKANIGEGAHKKIGIAFLEAYVTAVEATRAEQARQLNAFG